MLRMSVHGKRETNRKGSRRQKKKKRKREAETPKKTCSKSGASRWATRRRMRSESRYRSGGSVKALCKTISCESECIFNIQKSCLFMQADTPQNLETHIFVSYFLTIYVFFQISLPMFFIFLSFRTKKCRHLEHPIGKDTEKLLIL